MPDKQFLSEHPDQLTAPVTKQADGHGQHFLEFCPNHCPCGYPCTDVIGDDFKWRNPPMKITGWVEEKKRK